jgi:hypothetical protein
VNKFLDLVLATQLSTSFAWICAVVAHLTDKYANENWQFSVYISLGLSVLFMLAPYALFLSKENTSA